jgi:hypothetical protein
VDLLLTRQRLVYFGHRLKGLDHCNRGILLLLHGVELGVDLIARHFRSLSHRSIFPVIFADPGIDQRNHRLPSPQLIEHSGAIAGVTRSVLWMRTKL